MILNNISFICLYLIGFLLVLFLLCFMAFKIYDFISNKIENSLYKKLIKFCNDEKISVYIEGQKSISETAAGQIFYTVESNCGIVVRIFNEYIVLSKKWCNCPYVLGHEIGHYLQLKEELKTTEKGANLYAEKLCRSLLTNSQQKILSISLNCYFTNSCGNEN